jgi:uncharacterized protein YndB with AHSA1/START domain
VHELEVVRETVVAAPRERVWAALTEDDELASWFANEATLDVRPGGEGVFRWADGSERFLQVARVEDERLLEFEWSEPDGPATRVELALEDAEGGTLVRVREHAPAGPQASASPALVGEWAWGVALLAERTVLRRLAVA